MNPEASKKNYFREKKLYGIYMSHMWIKARKYAANQPQFEDLNHINLYICVFNKMKHMFQLYNTLRLHICNMCARKCDMFLLWFFSE